MGGARSDQHALALERRFAAHLMEERLGRRHDLQRLRHAAGTGLAALRHLAGVRPDHRNAVLCELRQIAPRRRMAPHQRIHRRSNQHRAVGRQQHRGGQVVGMAARHLGHEVGGRGRDHDQIGLARQPDMADVELGRGVEQIGEDPFTRKRAGRERGDELLRGGGEDAAHGRAAFLQPADEIERLIGRDAAADDQQDAPMAGLRRTFRRVERPAPVCEAFAFRFPAGPFISRPAAAWRRMVRASSSIERPFCAALRRRRVLVSSSSWRMVRLAIGSRFQGQHSR